jgi:hypothetical protein
MPDLMEEPAFPVDTACDMSPTCGPRLKLSKRLVSSV